MTPSGLVFSLFSNQTRNPTASMFPDIALLFAGGPKVCQWLSKCCKSQACRNWPSSPSSPVQPANSSRYGWTRSETAIARHLHVCHTLLDMTKMFHFANRLPVLFVNSEDALHALILYHFMHRFAVCYSPTKSSATNWFLFCVVVVSDTFMSAAV